MTRDELLVRQLVQRCTAQALLRVERKTDRLSSPGKHLCLRFLPTSPKLTKENQQVDPLGVDAVGIVQATEQVTDQVLTAQVRLNRSLIRWV